MILIKTASRLSDNLVGLNGILWVQCKTRKAWVCGACAGTVPKRSMMWRPMNERGGVVRYMRICSACVDLLCPTTKEEPCASTV